MSTKSRLEDIPINLQSSNDLSILYTIIHNYLWSERLMNSCPCRPLTLPILSLVSVMNRFSEDRYVGRNSNFALDILVGMLIANGEKKKKNVNTLLFLQHKTSEST